MEVLQGCCWARGLKLEVLLVALLDGWLVTCSLSGGPWGMEAGMEAGRARGRRRVPVALGWCR